MKTRLQQTVGRLNLGALSLGALGLVAIALLPLGSIAHATSPSFDCSKVKADSIEAMICHDDTLAALDRKMAEVYAEATNKAVNEHPPTLKAEQRGWIKGRNDCWKADDQRSCVENEYKQRIAALQATYRLVPIAGQGRYVCNNQPANEVIATYFDTDPPTAVAEYGDQTSLLYQQPAASGTKYQGRNETVWEHQGEAKITWGYGSPEMSCKVAK